MIIGGRPGMGKTSFAMNVAENIAVEHKVGVFSMEMPGTQLAMRMIIGMSGVSSRSMRSGILTKEELSQVSHAVDRLKGSNILVDDASALKPDDLYLRAQRMAKEGVKVIVVDYLQLMRKSNERMSEQESVSEYSSTLKRIAKDLGVRVIALSQLSRDNEKRVDKRPSPADLRNSGSIEQDADMIMFVYRDEVYNKDTIEPGVAEIIISKNRSGAIGTAKLGFDGSTTKFLNI
jgi:replicative DNA helicase